MLQIRLEKTKTTSDKERKLIDHSQTRLNPYHSCAFHLSVEELESNIRDTPVAERSCFYAIDSMRPTAPGRPVTKQQGITGVRLLPGDPAVAVGTGVVGFLLANHMTTLQDN